MKRKIYKYLFAVFFFVCLVWIFNYMIGAIHLKLYNKFKDNYTYKPISVKLKDKNNQFKRYYCEYLDTYERDWYQYEELIFTSDSTFTTSKKSTYFRNYFFPVKYYLGFLEKYSEPYLAKYKYIKDKVYSTKNDSLIGTIKENDHNFIFKHERP